MKTLRMLKLSFFWLVLLGSCGDNDLPKYQILGGLRILGFSTATPEASAGDTVSVTPILSDLDGAGRAITYVAAACMDPGIGIGATPSCIGSPTFVDLGTGTVTGLTGTDYTGAVGALTATIPATALSGRAAYDQHNGVAFIFTYEISVSSGPSIKSFRRIVVSTKAPKNTNPTLSDLLSNDISLTAAPAAESTFKFDSPPTSEESYQQQLKDSSYVTKTEHLQMSWFISDGELDRSRTFRGEGAMFKPPSTAPIGHNQLVIGILRDDRGGLSYLIKTL